MYVKLTDLKDHLSLETKVILLGNGILDFWEKDVNNKNGLMQMMEMEEYENIENNILEVIFYLNKHVFEGYQVLLNDIDYNKNNLFIYACLFKYERIANFIIDTWTNLPHFVSFIGETPLMIACKYNIESVIIRLLITDHKRLSHKSFLNKTAFDFLLMNSNENMMIFFIRQLSLVNERTSESTKNEIISVINDMNDKKVLHEIIRNESYTVIKFLLNFGFYLPFDLPDEDGTTPFLLATILCPEEIINLFLTNSYRLEGPPKLNVINKYNETPLFVLIHRQLEDLALKLFDFNVDLNLNIVNSLNLSALSLACGNNLPKVALKILEHTGDIAINSQELSSLNTALHYAIENGLFEVCDNMINHPDIDLFLVNNKKNSFLDQALKHQHENIGVKIINKTKGLILNFDKSNKRDYLMESLLLNYENLANEIVDFSNDPLTGCFYEIPKSTDLTGCTHLMVACKRSMEKIAIKIFSKINKDLAYKKNKFNESALNYAFENELKTFAFLMLKDYDFEKDNVHDKKLINTIFDIKLNPDNNLFDKSLNDLFVKKMHELHLREVQKEVEAKRILEENEREIQKIIEEEERLKQKRLLEAKKKADLKKNKNNKNINNNNNTKSNNSNSSPKKDEPKVINEKKDVFKVIDEIKEDINTNQCIRIEIPSPTNIVKVDSKSPKQVKKEMNKDKSPKINQEKKKKVSFNENLTVHNIVEEVKNIVIVEPETSVQETVIEEVKVNNIIQEPVQEPVIEENKENINNQVVQEPKLNFSKIIGSNKGLPNPNSLTFNHFNHIHNKLFINIIDTNKFYSENCSYDGKKSIDFTRILNEHQNDLKNPKKLIELFGSASNPIQPTIMLTSEGLLYEFDTLHSPPWKYYQLLSKKYNHLEIKVEAFDHSNKLFYSNMTLSNGIISY